MTLRVIHKIIAKENLKSAKIVNIRNNSLMIHRKKRRNQKRETKNIRNKLPNNFRVNNKKISLLKTR